MPNRDGHDKELVRELLEGGRRGQEAGLELLLRRDPECWQDAVELVRPSGLVSPRALEALTAAWRIYRRGQRADGSRER